MESHISISHDGKTLKAVLFLTWADMSKHGWQHVCAETVNGTIWRVYKDNPFTHAIRPETSESITDGCFWTYTCDLEDWSWYQEDVWVEYPIKWGKWNESRIDIEKAFDPDERESKVFKYTVYEVHKADGYVIAANKDEADKIVSSSLGWGAYSNEEPIDGFEFHHHSVEIDDTDETPEKWDRVLKRPTEVTREI